MRSWLDWKEEGKRAYERHDYSTALESYRKALRPEFECPTKADQAVLWSNVVACRLQLVVEKEGDPQARAAVEDAKQCVQLNPNWSKGYLRLASAYIALGGHSNDACNALQSAIRIDPGNSNARQMLIRELRRDHAAAAAAASNEVDESRDPPLNPDYVPPSSSPSSSSNTFSATNSATFSSSASTASASAPPSPRHDTAVDDGLTWRERVSFQMIRANEWYQNLNGDVKTMIKIGVLLLVMYVAFGGRFGLSSSMMSSESSARYHETGGRGNYGADNAYEQFRRQRQQQQQQQQQARRNSYDPSSRAGRDSYSSYHDDGGGYYDNSYYAPPRRQHHHSSWSSSSFSISNLFDGSLQSMLLLAGIAYICHRNGINPFQAIFMLNLMGGGRRRGGMYYGGGGYGGFNRRRGFRW